MLVLASASPRRRELLRQIGYTFQVIPADIAEVRNPGEAAIDFVQRLAFEKAQYIFNQQRASRNNPGDPLQVLGADTVVVVDGEVFGKPQDQADATRMLRALSGRTHVVMTGVCLVSDLGTRVAVGKTAVRFRHIRASETEAYVASGEPMDKAGAYAIQGRAARWIPSIEGCYFNVVGLPLALVSEMLEGDRAGS